MWSWPGRQNRETVFKILSRRESCTELALLSTPAESSRYVFTHAVPCFKERLLDPQANSPSTYADAPIRESTCSSSKQSVRAIRKIPAIRPRTRRLRSSENSSCNRTRGSFIEPLSSPISQWVYGRWRQSEAWSRQSTFYFLSFYCSRSLLSLE